jgi:hypothetical protein
MTRLDVIMSAVDSWADENAGIDCREEVIENVNNMLNDPEYDYWTDSMMIEDAIRFWELCE